LLLTQILGDQQAALVGQGCLKSGQAKNTFVLHCLHVSVSLLIVNAVEFLNLNFTEIMGLLWQVF